MQPEETTMRGIKRQEQQDVASQIEAFLASGGKIQKVPTGQGALKEGKKWGTDPIDVKKHESKK
jgi:hypothetical protein